LAVIGLAGALALSPLRLPGADGRRRRFGGGMFLRARSCNMPRQV